VDTIDGCGGERGGRDTREADAPEAEDRGGAPAGDLHGVQDGPVSRRDAAPQQPATAPPCRRAEAISFPDPSENTERLLDKPCKTYGVSGKATMKF